ncbi:BED zinc finger and hAT dimerization domain-containing protein DAYSLEEPER [Perilla frutescens var. hirtella]|uniref:BED zinc finger and hAT dimerization domain-containing protein DAYSLEEPER n=1 Tax=Perilla frutescens var. hirtella TaxID=608512 RepID=A0AAD4J8R6_PERFH|nr:BED zinc finger and hAT dimerization domain-containing protein DAYSLEEPER [Perilla frutescens var. hirtella]
MEAENSRVDTEIQDKNDDVCVIKKKRKKTSDVWFDFDDVEDPKLGRKAVCKHCKDRFAYGGKGSSTSHLKRHADSCFQKKLKNNTSTKQSTIPFKSSTSSMNPFLVPGAKYSNEYLSQLEAMNIKDTTSTKKEEESITRPFLLTNEALRNATSGSKVHACIKSRSSLQPQTISFESTLKLFTKQ